MTGVMDLSASPYYFDADEIVTMSRERLELCSYAWYLGDCLSSLIDLFANIPGLEVEIEEARLSFADPDPAAVPGAMDALLFGVEQLIDVSQLSAGSQQVLVLANDILVEAGVRGEK